MTRYALHKGDAQTAKLLFEAASQMLVMSSALRLLKVREHGPSMRDGCIGRGYFAERRGMDCFDVVMQGMTRQSEAKRTGSTVEDETCMMPYIYIYIYYNTTMILWLRYIMKPCRISIFNCMRQQCKEFSSNIAGEINT